MRRPVSRLHPPVAASAAFPSVPFGLLVLAMGLVAAPPVAAQEVTLELRPDLESVRACDELGVELVLSSDVGGVAGYQLFLSYPGEHFEAVGFEPVGFDGTIATAGFSEGTDPCAGATQVEDPVVAVAATVFAEEGGSATLGPIEAGVVGRLVFAPTGVAGTAEEVRFALLGISCSAVFDQRAKVFDAAGDDLGATVTGDFGVSTGGAAVEDLACELTGSDEVTLSWASPPGDVESVRILRDGESLVELDGAAAGYVDQGVDVSTSIEYEVNFVSAGGAEGCSATCTVAPAGLFIRGDSDGDLSITINDGVRVLRYLFLAGELDCLEAANANGDRSLNLSDGTYILNFLFSEGPAPPPPFPEPGFVPGADCQRGTV